MLGGSDGADDTHSSTMNNSNFSDFLSFVHVLFICLPSRSWFPGVWACWGQDISL